MTALTGNPARRMIHRPPRYRGFHVADVPGSDAAAPGPLSYHAYQRTAAMLQQAESVTLVLTPAGPGSHALLAITMWCTGAGLASGLGMVNSSTPPGDHNRYPTEDASTG